MPTHSATKPYPVVLSDTAESTILAALKTIHAVVAAPGGDFSTFPTFDDMGKSYENTARILNRAGKALLRKDEDRKEKARAAFKVKLTEAVETHANTLKARKYRDQWVGLSPEMKEEYPFKKSYIIPIKDISADIGAESAEAAHTLLKDLGYTLAPSTTKGEFNLVMPLAEPKAPTAAPVAGDD